MKDTTITTQEEMVMHSVQKDIIHIPVLLEVSVQSLALVAGDVVVDGTFGGGGHSTAIIKQGLESNLGLRLICVDLDEAALVRFQDRIATQFPALINQNMVSLVHSNFKDAVSIKEKAGVQTVSKVLLDLGTSTFQLLADTRGFSFMSDTPLSMAFSEAGAHTGFNAYDIVNTWQEDSIADIIYAYGEDRLSRKIARSIVTAREHGPITTSGQLADCIMQALGRKGRIHPATKTFQALRIAVNDELAVISEALNAWWEQLPPGGRISVITFHSLEDRIVKHWMVKQEHKKLITKKPITPDRQELAENPRSRSAKLRTIEKDISA